jgi:hypothetical protein
LSDRLLRGYVDDAPTDDSASIEECSRDVCHWSTTSDSNVVRREIGRPVNKDRRELASPFRGRDFDHFGSSVRQSVFAQGAAMR